MIKVLVFFTMLCISTATLSDEFELLDSRINKIDLCSIVEDTPGISSRDLGLPDISERVKKLYLSDILQASYGITESKALRITKFAQEITSEYSGFPRTKDVLAIAFIESSLNPSARSRWAEGLMGVNYNAHRIKDPKHIRRDPYFNMRHGVRILREYYEELRSVDLAIMAYNVGISAVRKGRTNHRYLTKYRREVSRFNH